jgi:NAD(P)-dependent dehydrogenase (short-subunit alcohol dehydrogenase family)
MKIQIGNVSGAITPHLKSEVFNMTMETNVMGIMRCVRAVTQVMMAQEPLSHIGRHGARSLGRGSIVNIGSVNSYVAAPGMLPYTTSKHAIIGITKSAGESTLILNHHYPPCRPKANHHYV